MPILNKANLYVHPQPVSAVGFWMDKVCFFSKARNVSPSLTDKTDGGEHIAVILGVHI